MHVCRCTICKRDESFHLFSAHFKFDSVPSLALFILSQFLFLFSSLFYFPPSNSRLANDIASQPNLEENPPSRPTKKTGETLVPKGDLPFKDKVPPIPFFRCRHHTHTAPCKRAFRLPRAERRTTNFSAQQPSNRHQHQHQQQANPAAQWKKGKNSQQPPQSSTSAARTAAANQAPIPDEKIGCHPGKEKKPLHFFFFLY